MTPPRPNRPHLATIVALTACMLAILAADLYVLREARQSTPVSLNDAVARFRSTDAAAGGATRAVAAEPGAPPSPSEDPGQRTELARGETTTSPAAPGSELGTAMEPTPMLHPLPAPGVYTYATSGGERISIGSASHTYPSETYATVRHLGGCRWENRTEIIEEHVDRRELCTTGGQLIQHAQERQVTFFGQTDGAVVVCDPPQVQHTAGDATGTTTEARCSDGNGTDITIVRTHLDEVELQVGDVTVRAIHFRLESTMTGRVNGSAVDEMWVWARDGLALRWDRSVDTVAQAAFGANVRYQEEASFRLVSLTPAT